MASPDNISIDQYAFDLPESRIARYPLTNRDASKLLLYHDSRITHDTFNTIADHFGKNDRLIFNATRVIRARLIFRKSNGTQIEVFCLDPSDPADYQQAFTSQESVEWKCLVGNAKKWKDELLEQTFVVGNQQLQLHVENLGKTEDGYLVRFSWTGRVSFAEVIEATGTTPIPPYLNRKAESSDAETYQTVYAKQDGSVAAPTAGLHFTDGILNTLAEKGVGLHELVLHVGAGTFIPVKGENALRHEMHAEYVTVSKPFLESLHRFTGRTTAVGTTVTRSLESIYWLGVRSLNDPGFTHENLLLEQWEAYTSDSGISIQKALGSLLKYMLKVQIDTLAFHTRLMIVPGYRFRMVDRLITNFHQPRSTLLLLVAAFIGDDWKKVYSYAHKNGFRFLSYGDSSLLERKNTRETESQNRGFISD